MESRVASRSRAADTVGRARRERDSRRLTSRLRSAAAGVASSVPGLLRRPARAASLAAPLALLLAALAFAMPAAAQDTTAPTFSSATVDGTSLVVTFSEAMNTAGNPASSVFRVTATPSGGSARTIDGTTTDPVTIDDDEVTVTLASAVAAGETVTVAYRGIALGAAKKVRDLADNNLADFSGKTVTNNSVAPTFSSATVDGTSLVITFSEAMNAAGNPASSVFQATASSSGTINGTTADPVTIDGAKVTVTLSSAVAAGETVTVAYSGIADSATNKVRDLADNNLADFSGETVANITGASAPKIASVKFRQWATYDADSDGRRDTYVEDDVVLVDVEFTEPVRVTGDGDVRLHLDLGADDSTQTNSRRTLRFPSVLNGGTTLRFEYTVEAGDTDTDGMWVQTDASDRVVLEPGTARVVGGDTDLAAVLTKRLPTTGGALFKVDGSKASAVGPRPTGATVNGSTLTVTFDQALGAVGVPDVGWGPDWYFTIRGTRNTADTATWELAPRAGTVAVVGDNNDQVQMTPAEPVRPGETIRLTYRLRSIWSVTGPFKGTDGKPAPGFADFPVTNETPGAAGPSLLRASVSGTTLRLVFDGDLDEGSAPPGSAFVVNTGSALAGYRDIRGTGQASVAGTVVTVELSHAVSSHARAWVAYAKPDSAPLQDADAAPVLPFGFLAVRTVYDVAPPEYVAGGAVQTGTSPDRSMVVLAFDEALDTASVPAGADFGVTVGTGTEINPASVAVKGKGVELTLNAAAPAGTTVMVSYTRGADPIRDRAGNAVATFAQAKELTATSAGAPAGQSATVDGSVLTVTWDKPLNPALVPAHWRFGLHYHAYTEDMKEWIDPYNNGVVGVAVRGSSLRLALFGPVFPCDGATPFTVSYGNASDGTPNLQGFDGVDAGALEYMDVTNQRASRCKTRSFSMSADSEGESLGKSLTLKSEVALDTGRELAASLFSLKGASPPALKNASYTDDATGVVLTLARAPTRGEALTVRYERPADAPGLWGADGNQIADFSVEVAKAAALTASFEGLPEAHDGAKRFAFEIRFSEEFRGLTLPALKRALAVTGGRLIDAKRTVPGQNRSVTVRVRPSQSGALTLALAAPSDCSAADAICASDGRKLAAVSATVPGPAANTLTASFHGLPAEHNGSKRFEFELRFSEEIAGLKLPAVRAALSVTGGRVIDMKRTAQGKNGSMTVRVRPASREDVTISLPATTDCAAAGAICTKDGRKLAALSATVQGPAALSVADAEATEGADAAVEFEVTLSRAASGAVTVDYATRDGTAKAGEDYERTRGTLIFAAGELEKTVSVPILDDPVDEGEETFTLKLMNPQGAAIGDGEATGTIENSDPLQKLWLSRFGRTVAIQTVEALEGRFAIGPDASPRMTVTVAGQSMDLGRVGDDRALAETMTGLARAFGAPGAPAANDNDRFARHGFGEAGNGTGVSAPARPVTGRELLLGSSFHFTTGEASGLGGAMTGWGKVLSGGSSSAFGGGLSFASETATGVLGMDWERDRLLVGVALSRSVEKGSASFGPTGVQYDIEGSLSMVTPYLRVRAGERLSFWSAVGSGSGSMSLSQGGGWQTADISTRLAAAGGRAELLRPGADGGLALALKTDAFFVRSESARVSTPGVGNLAAATGDASRLRAVLEGSRAFAVTGGGTLAPSLEIGLRHDGGDAETGSGVEIGAGLSWSAPAAGVTSDLRLYGLAAHEAGSYDEWGASGSLRMVPGASGRGLSLSMTPSWGAQGQAGRLWDAAPGGLAGDGGSEQPGMCFDTELGYGLPLSGGVTGTPYAGFGFGEAGARDYRLGWRLSSDRLPSLSLGIETARREAANSNEPAGHSMTLRAGLRW